jgi:hypothetical protein
VRCVAAENLSKPVGTNNTHGYLRRARSSLCVSEPLSPTAQHPQLQLRPGGATNKRRGSRSSLQRQVKIKFLCVPRSALMRHAQALLRGESVNDRGVFEGTVLEAIETSLTVKYAHRGTRSPGTCQRRVSERITRGAFFIR